jgi:hypothetical protein
LREAIEDELEAVMPGSLRVLRPADDSGMSSGPLSMALLDVDEIERHLLVDRVSQRFNASYDAVLKPLTCRIRRDAADQEQMSLSDNPFRPATIIKAISLSWHASEFDPMAVEDFLGVLDPRHGIDWAPLYAGLTETLVRAGFTAKPVHRIKRTSGTDSGMRRCTMAVRPLPAPGRRLVLRPTARWRPVMRSSQRRQPGARSATQHGRARARFPAETGLRAYAGRPAVRGCRWRAGWW